jgi:PTS system mannose-specific IIA component
MLKIIIVSHGNLGQEMVKSAEMIMGEQDNIETISLMMDQSFEAFIETVREKVDELTGSGREALMLVDLHGGTPANTVAATTRGKPVFALTGANLPILLEALARRSTDSAEELIETLRDLGRESIRILNRPS